MSPIDEMNKSLKGIELQLKSIDVQLAKLLQLVETMLEKKEPEETAHMAASNPDIPEMVSISEASRRTGLSYDYLRKECLKGSIKHLRVGCKYLINFGALREQLDMANGFFEERGQGEIIDV